VDRLRGKVAIVTGGGSGIGQATARCFAQEGASVVVTGRTASKLEVTKAAIEAIGGECEPVPGDVANVESCEAAVDTAVARWGSVDILVNNAAIDHEAEFFEIDQAAWERVLRVNLTAPFLLSQMCARVMRERGGGSIVHIGSIGGHFNDGPFFPYDTSKAGLLGLSRCMAVRLAQYGIRSNVVSPGATKTDLMTGLTGPKMDAYMASGFERVPIRRILEPEEIGWACTFLASDEASGVTGTELIVDGGMTADAYVLQSLPDFGEGPPKPFVADVGS
jgi:NAD(P)-dependent dehydrogenase (short-subunit alcohol dehydrogenase family)